MDVAIPVVLWQSGNEVVRPLVPGVYVQAEGRYPVVLWQSD